MVQAFYGCIFIASIVCTAIYIYRWHKHFNANISMIFAFVPITCLGHVFFGISGDMSEALISQKIIYLGTSFLQLFLREC